MRIEYSGDIVKGRDFLQRAQQEYRLLAGRPGRGGSFAREIEINGTVARINIHVGRGVDTIHIHVKETAFGSGAASAPYIFSGACIMEAQSTAEGMLAFAPTEHTKEQFNYPDAYLIHPNLNVASHLTMPGRIPQLGRSDTQYTTQNSSKYTGRMCRLVQVVQSYGTLAKNSAYTQAISQFLAQQGPGFVLPKSVLWVKENQGGVQNMFNWEYTRTHGLYKNPLGKNWLIEISNQGVKAMPLQIEPVTAMPEFKTFVQTEAAKSGAKGWWQDVLTILNEFGGFPSNQAFVSKEKFIKDQVVTILDASTMGYYTNGRGATPDIGWAFNELGTMADNICLEAMQDGSWYMAHHCRFVIGWDGANNKPTAQFWRVEFGSAPLGFGRLKVSHTAMEGCVSYNMDQTIPGNYSDRPKASQTAMHVFWKRDRLEVLRWSDGTVTPSVTKEERSSGIESGAKVTRVETWSGSTGRAAGFFCTHHDARLHYRESYHLNETTYKIEHERLREYKTDPATDDPEYFVRNFYAYHTERNKHEGGYLTEGCSAFIPLGDRSAFYITTMTSKTSDTDVFTVTPLTAGDPYAYLVRSTYIWNWDFGTQCGKPFPVTFGGSTATGLYHVVWDRGGSSGEGQAHKYCDPFVWGPMPYKGAPRWYGWSPTWQQTADEWTAMTGQSEWFSPGTSQSWEEAYRYTPYGGERPAAYNKSTPNTATLTVFLVSMHMTDKIFEVYGSRGYVYTNYFYWFDPSPNSEGVLQTMWAFNNRFGDKHYQLYSVDVNDSNLAADTEYQLPTSMFPTFIGVVGTIPEP